jgi:hypothetical protein
MNQKTIQAITIDLTTIQANAKLSENDLIQRHIYRALADRVGARLEWVKGCKKDSETSLPAGMGWVSFIDGTRGAGKSTFLHTAITLLGEKYPGLAVMNWIDPSRVEGSEILLLTILHELNERVKAKLKPLATSEHLRREHECWRKAFKNVAGGLAMFQKDHHPLAELDEDLFLDLGLEQAGHSANLRNNLNDLFATACEILGAEALLFVFDDADTSSKHAINLIETIRKYLDTPRVMILITGDLELYSLLVRQNFRHELAQGKRDEWGVEGAASGRADQQTRMLDHLEEQYLLKLFPLRERHHLFPVWRFAAQFEVINGSSPTELIKFTRGKIEEGFCLATASDINLYTEYLLMQPIRSALQVLSRISDKQNSTTDTHTFSTAMLDLALQNLYHYNIAAEDLAAEDFRTLTEAVFKVAMDDGDADTSAYLRPTSAQAHNRGAMFGLSAAVAQQLRRKPGTCIAYLLRGPGLVKLAHMAANSNKRGLSEAVLNKEFNRYMGVGRKDDALGWARLATVALVSEYAKNPTSRVVYYGVVGLNQSSSEGYTAYSKTFNNIKPYPAAAFSLVKSSGTGPRTFASIYNLLGLIGRLLELMETPSWKTQSKESQKSDIKALLGGFFPNTNSVSVPPWIAESNTDNDSSEDTANSDTGDEDVESRLNPWVDKLHAWLIAAEPCAKDIQPSSVFMGKVWPRLFFGLENISDALRPLGKGDFSLMMEMFALCVVNSFLAEEFAFHKINTSKGDVKTLSNPVTSADKYLTELQKIKGTITVQRLPLTFIVATCPLIAGLIKDERFQGDNAFEWPFKFEQNTPNNFISDDVWAMLEKIAIQGKKTPLQTEPVKPPKARKGLKQTEGSSDTTGEGGN